MNSATVTIGGVNAPVSFSGLAPGYVGPVSSERAGSSGASRRKSAGDYRYWRHAEQIGVTTGSVSFRCVADLIA